MALGVDGSRLYESAALAELAAVEKALDASPKLWAPDGLILAPTGVYVNKRKAETHEQLAPRRARELVASASLHSMIIYPTFPGDTLTMILQGASVLARKAVRLGVVHDGKIREDCFVDFVPKLGPQDEQPVQISIFVNRDEVWVGLSRVNEYQQIPNLKAELDGDKLEVTVREHKASAFFQDRQDIEIAFEPNLPLASHLRALWAVCKHFHEVAVVAPADLAAMPTL